MVGGVLPGFTVNTKLVETVRVPSLTVIVMVEVPLCPAAGVMIALRPAPLPPKAILATGISTAFDEVADSVNAFGEVSASPIVNAIAPVGVSSFVDCGPMAVMVGGVFGLTVSTKFVDVVSASVADSDGDGRRAACSCNRRDGYSSVCTASTKGDVCVWNQRCI